MSGLRFCMVTTFYPPYNFGGDGIGVQRLSQALVRHGHAVTVIHDIDAYRAVAPAGAPAGEAARDGVEVVGLKTRLGRVSTLLTQQSGRPVGTRHALASALDRRSFDVIHYHNVSLIGGPSILATGRGLKLYTAHEHWLVCPTHVLWRDNREPCTGRRCLRCTLHHRRPPQVWRYTGHLERQLVHVDSFIAASEFSRRKHREFGFPREMEVLPYFVADADNPAPGRDPSPHGRPYFLFVGRLERMKGLEDVIPVFETYGDADLLIAGDGQHADALRALAAGNPRVRFLGPVESRELERHYRHAVALIAPSVGYETFGITLIEAFREGTPVLARRIGPFPEIVDACGGGELFGDRAELVRAMRRLQGDPAHRRRLSQAAQRGFASHWSESAVLPQYLDIVRRTARDVGHSVLAAAV